MRGVRVALHQMAQRGQKRRAEAEARRAGLAVHVLQVEHEHHREHEVREERRRTLTRHRLRAAELLQRERQRPEARFELSQREHQACHVRGATARS